MLFVYFLLFTVFFVNLEALQLSQLLLLTGTQLTSNLPSGSDDIPQLEIIINPQPKSKSSPQSGILLKRVEDTLNLTCRIISPINEVLPKYKILWHVPTMAQNREHRVTRTPGTNMLILVIHNLLETDSGDYTCEAMRSHDDISDYDLKRTIRINVKSKKSYCSEHMFQCPTGNCISKRYMCDGKEDCKNGVDEAEHHCGPDPCGTKYMCSDGRCIPKSWCCDQYFDSNCTVKEKLPCCQHYLKPPYMDVDPSVFQTDQQRYSDMGFLQTTIYAVVGSAMAFMFIVTVLIIAICRIHLKRHSTLTRCTANNRVTRTHHHIPNLYDLDMCINRPFVSPTDELTHTPGFLVTYNINNGVQFVGRPVNPPPYCEIVSTPPREGPPPPYISQENLARTSECELAEEQPEETVEREQVVEEEVIEEANEHEEVRRPLRSDENDDK